MRAPVKLLFALAALVVLVMALANTLFEHDVHAWRHDGACLDCHSRQGEVDLKDGWTIPPPPSHDDRFRRYTHGKTDGFSPERCTACHRASECVDCHARAPESHTSDFVRPRGQGMERHILLAAIRPATCLTCHESFITACVGCHTRAEVQPWETQARRQLPAVGAAR
jgi:hypothetical protein